MKNCEYCGIEFESKRADSKYCSPNCKLKAFRKSSIETDNVTFSEPNETDNFKFTIKAKKDDPFLENKKRVRTEKYWYDVPLAAVPVYQKGWPKMPDYMNGRQYFLWWKNEFKVNEDPDKGELGIPVIHNPFPARDLRYEQAGEGARRWGI